MSNPLKSNTHQNVTIGALVVGGGLAWFIAVMRANAPSLITWGIGADGAVIAGAVTILGPFVSRQLAFFRDSDKAADFRPFGEVKEGILDPPKAYTNHHGVRISEAPPKEPKPDPPEDE